MPKALIASLASEELKAEAARSPKVAEALSTATAALDTATTKITTVKTALTSFKTAYEAATDLDDVKETAEALIALLPNL